MRSIGFIDAAHYLLLIALIVGGCGRDEPAAKPGSSTKSQKPLSSFAQELAASDIISQMRVGEKRELNMSIKNSGPDTWAAVGDSGVTLSYNWFDAKRTPVSLASGGGLRTHLPTDLKSGESMRLKAAVAAPAEPGKYTLRWTMVQENVAWFDQKGGKSLDMAVNIKK